MLFKTPWILILLPVVFLIVFFAHRRNKTPGFRFSSVELFDGLPVGWRVRFSPATGILRLAALLLFVVALAGPRQVLEETIHETEGIDIVLALDSSGSMAAEDLKIDGQRYNRLFIIKNVVRDFIQERKNDRIGLVAFGGLAYTVCPLTTDQSWILANLERVELGMLEDGTAIGSAISSSLNRLKNNHAKSKVIVLLTDGMNNAGKVDPLVAAKMAKTMGVKIYTIGAGTKGLAPFPMKDFFGRTVYQNVLIDLDEKSLQQIAEVSGGKYFRATDTESLRRVYQEIDALEKTKIEETGYKEYRELFARFLLAAFFILLLESFLTNTVFLRIP